jgi:hypothetical protein
MPAQRMAEILLKFRAENGEGLKSLDQVQKKMADTTKVAGNLSTQLDSSFTKSGVRADFFAGRLAQIKQRADGVRIGNAELKTELDKLDDSFDKAAESSEELAKANEHVSDSFEKVGDRARDARGRFLPSGSSGAAGSGGSSGGDTSGDGGDNSGGDSGGGSTRSGTFGLKSFGRELKNLPAIQIPGLGISTDAVGKLTQLAGNLTPAALAAGGAVGVLSTALVLLTTSAKAAKDAALAELDARAKAIALIKTGSQAEIQARINELTKQREANKAVADDANAFLANLRASINATGKNQQALAEFNSTLGTGAGELSAAKEAAEKANKEFNNATTELDLLSQASGLSAQTTQDLAKAEASLQLRRATATEDIARIENQLAANREAQQQIDSGSAEGLAKRKRDIYNELIAIEEATDATADKVRASEGDIEKQRLYREELKKLKAQFDTLSVTYDVLSTSLVENAVAANDAAKQAEEIRKDSITATKKYDDEVAKAEEDNLKQRADIQNKYNDALVKAADTAVAAAQAAYDKLKGQQDKLGLALERGENSVQAKIEFDAAKKATERARTEVKDAQDHAAKLREIRLKSQEDDENLVAKRDFAGLYRSRRATTLALQQETDRYDQERSAKLVSYAQQDDDEAKQQAFERSQRLEKYRQDLSDAQTAYNTDIRNAAAARDKAIQLAVQTRDKEYQAQYDKYNSTLSLLKAGIVAELQLIEKGNAGKLALEERYYAQSRALLAGAVTAANLGGNINGKAAGLAFKAKGGGLRKGQLAAVNEPDSTGREGFNRIAFPRMAGLFMPMQAGTVNRDTGKPSISNVWNITGNDPEAIGAVVERKVGEQLDYYFG